MAAGRRKRSREQDVTERYLAGDMDDDAGNKNQKYNNRTKIAQQEKIERTTAMRAAAVLAGPADAESLPTGQVTQVYSLYCEVVSGSDVWLCTTRKTLTKISKSAIVVGDRVRFRPTDRKDDLGRPEAVIEQVLPRETILTRSDSFTGRNQHPIVANAEQMLIVVSLLHPAVKWGLVDRMLIAAQGGNIKPIICLNKIDLAGNDEDGRALLTEADGVLAHYRTLGALTMLTSVDDNVGLEELRSTLKDHSTVLAGHSGVGKSSLISAIQPSLDIRIGEVSDYTAKGRHTTTSAKHYPLDFGGAVIDTPGVKMFGLWGVTRENLKEFFPDVASGSAPDWRKESFERISESLNGRD